MKSTMTCLECCNLNQRGQTDRHSDRDLERNVDSHLDMPMLLESNMYGQKITGM